MGKYLELYQQLSKFIPKGRLITDELRKLTYGTDASFYRLIPQLVVKVETEKEVADVLSRCNELEIPVTFRAAGTSLSGQSISDSVLLILGSTWNKFNISDDASTITLQPGIIGGHANIFLAPYNKKIGPDPASINAAMIGGIAANNASGMCCGTSQNSYKTLAGMKIIFNDGTILNTNDDLSKQSFSKSNARLISGIKELSTKVKSNPEVSEKICRKFRMKNTTGYSLNALVDFEDPFEIIQHLMIGSEGTLGFISEITYKTVPDYPNKATSLMIFPNAITACSAVIILKKLKVEAVEIMDRAALRSVENKKGMPHFLKNLDENAAALLVETRAVDNVELQKQIDEIITALNEISKIYPVTFTQNTAEFKKLWDIRKGLFPSVGAMRKTGTSVIIEDVAFPLERLAEGTMDLQNLFKKHGYYDAIIFGHALEGNLHFVFKQDFNIPAEVNRYKSFIEDITKLVVKKYDGSLKAEHGTGRNMAPFVELEWGNEAYQIMKEIKNLFDPSEILNPGVILNSDNQVHIKNLKPLPAANPIVDKCIECGFCEVNCPSKDLTLTPRHRIVAWREISRLKNTGEDPVKLSTLLNEYDYYGNQTCATDGLCEISCPVEINTGTLIKELRSENISPSGQSIADLISGNMNIITSVMRMMLNLVDIIHSIIGTSLMSRISKILYKLSGRKIPLWNKYMPKGADPIVIKSIDISNRSIPSHTEGIFLEKESFGAGKVIYFPACINRAMGISKDSREKESLTTKTHSLLRKAGYEVIYPDNISNLCCGMAFSSKGFKKQGDRKSKELQNELLKASEYGKYPVLFDMSPCLYSMKEFLQNHGSTSGRSNIKIYEPVEFIMEFMLERLQFNKTSETIAIHSTCSSVKMGLTDKLKQLAELCSDNVILPHGVGCCGWAGDRGFTYPELNESALINLKDEIPDECAHGYSTSRTCEIGLSLHSGINYESIIYLVDKCTSRKDSH